MALRRPVKADVRIFAAVFVLGGIGGALVDQLHVRSDALAYPHPHLWGQPLWVAPEFGVGVLAIVAGTLPLAKWALRTGRSPGAGSIAGDAVWFVAAYISTALWWRHHAAALTIGLALVWLARLALPGGWRERAPAAVASVVLAVGGCLYEGTLAATGAFAYARPTIYHVPLWLAGIYLHAASLALAATARIHLALEPGRAVAVGQ